MAINLDAVGATSAPWTRRWTESDSLLYALAVGAGPDDLAFTTENSQGVRLQAYPTFAAIIAGGSSRLREHLGSWDSATLVHAGQRLTWFTTLPPAGEVTLRARVHAITDKGSGALIEIDTTATDPTTDAPMFQARSSLFIRGAGGFGGAARTRQTAHNRDTDRAEPAGAPDATPRFALASTQALLYRLCGDRNPLHSDPAFARRAGFDRPILHGLCTYGVTARLLLNEVAGGDPGRVRELSGRFRAPTYPGDEIEVRIWHAGTDRVAFQTLSRGSAVIDHGELRLGAVA